MLQNAYFLAKIGADTAENERNFAEKLPKIGTYGGPTARRRSPRRRRCHPLYHGSPRLLLTLVVESLEERLFLELLAKEAALAYAVFFSIRSVVFSVLFRTYNMNTFRKTQRGNITIGTKNDEFDTTIKHVLLVWQQATHVLTINTIQQSKQADTTSRI